MGNFSGGGALRWSEEEKEILIATLKFASENSISQKSGMVSCSEKIHEELGIYRTVKAIHERYYAMIRTKEIEPLVFANERESNSSVISESNDSMDTASAFLKMKKIIRERDEMKSKLEDAYTWKAKFEEANRELTKLRKEKASFMELLREQA